MTARRALDPEREQARGLPLGHADFAAFRRHGVDGRHLACARHGCDLVLRDLVVFGKRQRFGFARHDGGEGPGAVEAYTIPARDAGGALVDVVAWDPAAGRLATWLGAVGMLGEDSLWRPLADKEPLVVHRDPVGWLAAGWRGVVVINDALARPALLGAGTLLTQDIAHGEAVEAMLRKVRMPRILVEAP
ncbi:hypothetical protein [Methylobacterium nodulans]|uniref:Uncharacterized protein n=1 Tax=Methylobacterium nodulans (strain LMG 21967 / CNCM I-2342 / ORS 2060) TaxID=460265 RepID=B8IRK2_METNO|nr:hypothetical protein [Methylobacterium nodulans]ACL58742.1 hypothetical protein Mnod_3842 [Methylobacterium nodulans ORS 2060]